MLDVSVSVMGLPLAQLHIDGEGPDRIGNEHPTAAPFDAFLCADEEYLVVAISSDACASHPPIPRPTRGMACRPFILALAFCFCFASLCPVVVHCRPQPR